MFIHDRGSERQIRKPSAELAPKGCEGSKSHVPAQKHTHTHAERARKYTHIWREKKGKIRSLLLDHTRACLRFGLERYPSHKRAACGFSSRTNGGVLSTRLHHHYQSEGCCVSSAFRFFFFFFFLFLLYISRWGSLLGSSRCLTLICQQRLSCHDRQHAQKNAARDAVYLPCACVYACVRTFTVKMARGGEGGGREETDDDDVQSSSEEGGNEASSVAQSGFKSCSFPSLAAQICSHCSPLTTPPPPVPRLCPETMHSSMIPECPCLVL